jgi:hypothetical protein
MVRQISVLVIIVAGAAAAACTRTAAPATCPPAAAASAAAADADAVPPEDDAVRKWKAIAETKDRAPPAGTTAAALVPELIEYLGSPDPVRRDRIGYEQLAFWISRDVLTADEVRAVMQQLVANLAGPLDAPDGVFRRSFSALVLAEVANRDRKRPFLTVDERRALLAAAVAYAGRETDLRGHVGAKGWAHAAAHTADLLAQLAQLTGLTDDDRAQVYDAVAALTTRRHGAIYAYGEDGRLAVAVFAAAKAGVPATATTALMTALRGPLVERMTPEFDAPLFAAQRNARNLLFTLYVQGSLSPEATPGERALFDAVKALLAG